MVVLLSTGLRQAQAERTINGYAAVTDYPGTAARAGVNVAQGEEAKPPPLNADS